MQPVSAQKQELAKRQCLRYTGGMSKNIVIITASLRSNSNSDTLAAAFAEGAAGAGHQVETISLRGKTLAFCRGCFACQELGHCVMNDDADAITARVAAADVVVFATPVYYYGMAGQMKVLIDRMNALFTKEYAFRDIYLLTTCADESEDELHHVTSGIEGWVACFEHARLAGVLHAPANTAPGDILKQPAQLDRARALGAAV